MARPMSNRYALTMQRLTTRRVRDLVPTGGHSSALIVGCVVLLVAVLLSIASTALATPAKLRVDGARILHLPAGDLQVLEKAPTHPVRNPKTVVLLHGNTNAIGWWDDLIPWVNQRHRVVAIDLLGHGGSQKPDSPRRYSMRYQAGAVGQVLDDLNVKNATVVGHSMGATVATALVEHRRDLVERLVIINQAPNNNDGRDSWCAWLSRLPVVGHCMWGTTGCAADQTLKEELGEAFAPGFDPPDRLVDDLRQVRYISYKSSEEAENYYTATQPLDYRLLRANIPLLVLFGVQDQLFDAKKAVAAYQGLPNARVELIEGAGHSPHVEKPRETAKLISDFIESAAQLERREAPDSLDKGKQRA